MSDQNDLIADTLQTIFAKSNGHLPEEPQPRKKKTKKVPKKDLELALAILLVDLASCDQNFDQQEYLLISRGLRRIFGTSKLQVTGLVNQAQGVLKNLRGTSRFAETLKKQLTLEERIVILDVIDEVIEADGVEDGFETYLRHKFRDLLGIPEDKIPVKESAEEEEAELS